MDMVVHKHICIEPCMAFTFGLSQTIQKDPVVLRCQKDGLPIIAALDDMMGKGGKAEPR
jgi:hypothetical protein